MPENIKGTIIRSWKMSKESARPERSRNWYIWFFVIFAIFIILALVTLNFLFAAIIIIVGFIVLIERFNKPVLYTFTMTDRGLYLNEEFYGWGDFSEFILFDDSKDLYLERGKFMNPYIKIPLEDQDLQDMREVLLQFLPENTERQEEFLFDKIQRWLKI